MSKPITFEEFTEKYKPQLNHLAQISNPSPDPESCAPLNGQMYETYGEELEHIKAQNPNHVWTVLVIDEVDENGEDLPWYVSAGFHHVNRMGYIITKNPWETGTEEAEY